MMRLVPLVIPALVLLLSWSPALAQDNHGYRTTTLSGTAANYGTIETSGNAEHGMSSGAGESSTNAASGSIITSGNNSHGIVSSGGGTVTNAGSILTQGPNGRGVYSTDGGSVTNTGTIEVQGDSGYGIFSTGGGSVINSGAIVISGDSDGLRLDDAGTATNTGTITATGDAINGFGVEDAGGVGINTGTITVTGRWSRGAAVNGTFTNHGIIVSREGTGIFVLNGGTVYNDGSITGGDQGHAIEITNSGTIHLRTGTCILAGDVYGEDWVGSVNNLFLDGSGTVNFDISGKWTDITKTDAGTWTLARNISGAVTDLNVQGGVLALSSGVHLNIGGDYVQAAGTTLALSADGTTTPLVLGGTATLAGTLLVDPAPAATVLTAAGGRGGTTFDAVASANPHFAVALQYPDANTVSVTTTFTPQWDAPSVGMTTALSTTQALSGLASGRSFQLLARADGSGSPFGQGPVLVASAGSLEGLLAAGEDEDEPLWGMYLKPMAATGSRRSGDAALGFHSRSSGLELGLDRKVADEVFLGVMAAYARTELAFTGSAFVAGDSEEQAVTTLGLYGGWGPGPWRVTDVLSVGRVDHESSRNAGLGQTAKADYDSWLLSNELQAAYVWAPAAGWEITPLLGLTATHVSRAGFAEYGAVNAVRYDDFDQTFWEGRLGLRAARAFQAGETTVTPYAGLGYSRDLGGNDVTVRQHLGGASAQVTTTNDDDRLTTEAGLTMARSDGDMPLKLTLAYDGQYGDDSESHGLSATLRWEF